MHRARLSRAFRCFGLAAAALAAASTPGAALAQHEEAVAPQLERFWSREVRAVQPRAVSTAGAIEALAAVGVIPNDPFIVYMPLGLWLGYHLHEEWAVEAGFAYNVQLDTGLRDYLEESDAQLRARIRERQQLRASLGLAWSPVYGKVAVGGGILHLGLHLTAGAGVVRVEDLAELGIDGGLRADGYLGAGLRLFLTGRWLLRVEYRQHMFLRPVDRSGGGGGLGFPAELTLAAGALLGGRR